MLLFLSYTWVDSDKALSINACHARCCYRCTSHSHWWSDIVCTSYCEENKRYLILSQDVCRFAMCFHVAFLSCLFFFWHMFCVCCLQLKSGYSSTGSSVGLPGGQITLNIQKVSIQRNEINIFVYLFAHNWLHISDASLSWQNSVFIPCTFVLSITHYLFLS